MAIIFESGNSPTGRGLEDVRLRIMQAFDKIREPQPVKVPPVPPSAVLYSETHQKRFHRYANALSLSALNLPLISNPTGNGVFEVSPPSETAEQLIREALGDR